MAMDFTHEKVAPRCQQLVHRYYGTKAAPRLVFVHVVMSLITLISVTTQQAQHLTAMVDIDIEASKRALSADVESLGIPVPSEYRPPAIDATTSK